MPENSINIVGGHIPKVRIEKVTLSNGGKMVVSDDPHVVETGIMHANIKTVDTHDFENTIQETWFGNHLNAQDRINKEYAAAVRQSERDLRRFGVLGANLDMAARRLTVARYLHQYYTRNFSAKAGQARGFRPELPQATVVFLATGPGTDGGKITLPSRPDFAVHGDPSPRNTPAKLLRYLRPVHPRYVKYFERSLADWFEMGMSTSQIIDGSPEEITLQRLSSPEAFPGAIMWSHSPPSASVIPGGTAAFMWSVVRSAYQKYRDYVSGLRSDRRQLEVLDVAETTNPLTIDLLLSVKDFSGTATPSWLSRSDMSKYFEFVVFHTDSLPLIDSFKNSKNQSQSMEWLRAQGVDIHFNEADRFVGQNHSHLVLKKSGPYSIKELAEAHRGAQASLDEINVEGNFVRDFNFPLSFTFEKEAANLAFFILPYFNVAAFMKETMPDAPDPGVDTWYQKETAREVRLETEAELAAVNREGFNRFGRHGPFGWTERTELRYIDAGEGTTLTRRANVNEILRARYMKYFIGALTPELVFKNSKTIKESSVFTYTHTTPAGLQEERAWSGPVHYHAQDTNALQQAARTTRGEAATNASYVGWMGGAEHDPSLTQEEARQLQPPLRQILVPNNKVQDFRMVERMQHLFTDLSPLDVKEFDPEIKNPNNQQKVDLNNSYFSDISLTTDIDKSVSLFMAFDVESFLKRETLFSRAGSSFVKLDHVEIKRRQVRDVSTRNRVGGLSADIPKIDEGDYELPDTLLLSGKAGPTSRATIIVSTDRDDPRLDRRRQSSAPGVIATFKDITDFVQNKIKAPEVRERRSFGKTKFFTFKDRSAQHLTSGKYQYRIKFSILDNTPEFLKLKRNEISTFLRRLTTYYDLAMEKENYNIILNKFHKNVIDRLLRSHGRDSKYTFFSRQAEGGPLHLQASSPSGIFISTLQLFSAENETFDIESVTATLQSFLDPNTATRDTIFKVIQTVNDVIAKIDYLLGSSSVPTTGNSSASQTRTPPAGAKNNKLIEIEQGTTTLFDATYPRAAGYYYMSPFFSDERPSNGIRKVQKSNIATMQAIERRKSFGPSTAGGAITPDLTQDYAYYTPLYATVPKLDASFAEGLARNALFTGSAGFPDNTLGMPFTNANEAGVQVLMHFTSATEESERPPWKDPRAKYNTVTDMIRTLNLAKGQEALTQGVEISDQLHITSDAARRSQLAQDALLKIFTPQGCSVITPVTLGGLDIISLPHLAPPQPNQNTSFSPSVHTPGHAQLPELKVQGVVRTTKSDQRGISVLTKNLGRGNSSDTIQDYLDSFTRPGNIPANGVMRSILIDEGLQLNPTSFSSLTTDDEFQDSRFFESVISLPAPMKLLAFLYVTANVAQRFQLLASWPTTQSPTRVLALPDITGTENMGFFDIHFNKIVELQVLAGFEMSATGGPLVDHPIWRKATAPDLAANSVCRYVPYANSDIKTAQPEYLDMPIFDSIFLVEGDGDLRWNPDAEMMSSEEWIERQMEEGGLVMGAQRDDGSEAGPAAVARSQGVLNNDSQARQSQSPQSSVRSDPGDQWSMF
jgi:hypothetical protein